MSEPFLAEIRIIGFNFAPRDWAFCDGQILPINQNQSLYSLLGTTYGGDGRTSFALPDLQGRAPIHFGSSNGSTHMLGQKGGEETHVLNTLEMPAHTHRLRGSTAEGDTPIPGFPADPPDPAVANVLAKSPSQVYVDSEQAGVLDPMAAGTIANSGGAQPHNNMQPVLVLNFCIALRGLFPSRN